MSRSTSSHYRIYVAMCNRSNFEGYYFRKFQLPMGYENNKTEATYYFLNILDSFSCVESIITIEDYLTVYGPIEIDLNEMREKFDYNYTK